MENIRHLVENSTHLKEKVGLNFRTIPDPFGSYEFKIPKYELIDISIMPDPKGKPGLDLSTPFQVSQGNSSAINESLEKNNVLSKIANLRNEIKKDDRYVNHMKKLRDDVKDANSQSKDKETKSIDKEDF